VGSPRWTRSRLGGVGGFETRPVGAPQPPRQSARSAVMARRRCLRSADVARRRCRTPLVEQLAGGGVSKLLSALPAGRGRGLVGSVASRRARWALLSHLDSRPAPLSWLAGGA